MEHDRIDNPLISELADDSDMLELIELFVQELPKRVHSLQNALRVGDLPTLCRLAHQLKGAAGGYGFPAITEAAGELERIARAPSDLEKLALEVRQVTELCSRVRVASEA